MDMERDENLAPPDEGKPKQSGFLSPFMAGVRAMLSPAIKEQPSQGSPGTPSGRSVLRDMNAPGSPNSSHLPPVAQAQDDPGAAADLQAVVGEPPLGKSSWTEQGDRRSVASEVSFVSALSQDNNSPLPDVLQRSAGKFNGLESDTDTSTAYESAGETEGNLSSQEDQFRSFISESTPNHPTAFSSPFEGDVFVSDEVAVGLKSANADANLDDLDSNNDLNETLQVEESQENQNVNISGLAEHFCGLSLYTPLKSSNSFAKTHVTLDSDVSGDIILSPERDNLSAKQSEILDLGEQAERTAFVNDEEHTDSNQVVNVSSDVSFNANQTINISSDALDNSQALEGGKNLTVESNSNTASEISATELKLLDDLLQSSYPPFSPSISSTTGTTANILDVSGKGLNGSHREVGLDQTVFEVKSNAQEEVQTVASESSTNPIVELSEAPEKSTCNVSVECSHVKEILNTDFDDEHPVVVGKVNESSPEISSDEVLLHSSDSFKASLNEDQNKDFSACSTNGGIESKERRVTEVLTCEVPPGNDCCPTSEEDSGNFHSVSQELDVKPSSLNSDAPDVICFKKDFQTTTSQTSSGSEVISPSVSFCSDSATSSNQVSPISSEIPEANSIGLSPVLPEPVTDVKSFSSSLEEAPETFARQSPKLSESILNSASQVSCGESIKVSEQTLAEVTPVNKSETVSGASVNDYPPCKDFASSCFDETVKEDTETVPTPKSPALPASHSTLLLEETPIPAKAPLTFEELLAAALANQSNPEEAVPSFSASNSASAAGRKLNESYHSIISSGSTSLELECEPIFTSESAPVDLDSDINERYESLIERCKLQEQDLEQGDSVLESVSAEAQRLSISCLSGSGKTNIAESEESLSSNSPNQTIIMAENILSSKSNSFSLNGEEEHSSHSGEQVLSGKPLLDSCLNLEEEEFRSGDAFKDPSAFDFLSLHGGVSSARDLRKESLYVKFDPLVGSLISDSFSSMHPDNSSHSKDQAKTDVDKVADEVAKLISLSPSAGSKQAQSDSQVEATTTPIKSSNLSTPVRTPAHVMLNETLQSIESQKTPVKQADLIKTIQDHQSAFEEQDRAYQEHIAELNKRIQEMEVQGKDHLRLLQEKDQQLQEKVQSLGELNVIMKEYEKTISRLVAEKSQEKAALEEKQVDLVKERDQAQQHLNNLEIAFADIHSKYERLKSVVEAFKKNEETLNAALADKQANFDKMQNMYDMLKSHAVSKLEKANQDLEAIKQKHQQENAKLKAMVKKLEVKSKSLEDALEQKAKENQALTAICDELINKVGE